MLETQIKKPSICAKSLELFESPYEALIKSKNLIKAWSVALNDKEKLEFGRAFVYLIIKSYWEVIYPSNTTFQLAKFDTNFKFQENTSLISFAASLGITASKLGVIEASFFIGSIYTITIPDTERSAKGVYFTPPSLANRLLSLVEDQEINWSQVKVLDPACGGGAFLAPVALKIVSALELNNAESLLTHIETHIKGYEIDSFSAWLSQVFVEIALSKYCIIANRKLKSLIDVCDSLKRESNEKFDIIIGNPPYGKIKLDNEIRTKFKESLYGHANLYGLFTHFALEQVTPNGVIAYVTPTSFLAGEYFKNLRKFVLTKTKPKVFDFIFFRKGVFEDVLQETMLAVYKSCKTTNNTVVINEIHPEPNKPIKSNVVGTFDLPQNPSNVWILPRNVQQSPLAHAMGCMPSKLKDWGYEVITGQLVWNRHKSQLTNNEGENTYPLIWAESITPNGNFLWKAEKKNHTLLFKINPGEEYLLTNYSCILLQRTTAKEQHRRLIASILPSKIIDKYKGVVVENHINIIKPLKNQPLVSLDILHVFLNSKAADIAFRCISGSVAVSAYELETMPLPNPKELRQVQKLIDLRKGKEDLEKAFLKMYNLNERIS